MKRVISADNKAQSVTFNRAAYILYMILVLFQLITGEYDWAISNLGIALLFDPFAPIKWQNRTKKQKAWLSIHLTILFAGAAFFYLR